MSAVDHGLTVNATRDLGIQFLDNPHQMVGQDGAYSIPLSDGRTLWYFGDTLIGERPDRTLHEIFRTPRDGKVETGAGPFEQMITNTGLLLPPQTGADGLSGFTYILDRDRRLKKLVPSLPDEDPELDRIWCLHGIELDDRIYLFYMRIRMHERIAHADDLGFEVVGSGLAVGTAQDWSFQRLEDEQSTLWWSVDQPQFGAAALHHPPTGYVYIYGSLQDGRAEQQACVARVRPERIGSRSAYEYYVGDGWDRDISRAARLFGGQPNELSVSHNPYLGRYLAVHSMALSGDLVGRTAETPWGPWSEPAVLWSVPEQTRAVKPGEPPRSFYAGKEHPALAADGGRVLYLTYIDSAEYYPHLIEVTLA